MAARIACVILHELEKGRQSITGVKERPNCSRQAAKPETNGADAGRVGCTI